MGRTLLLSSLLIILLFSCKLKEESPTEPDNGGEDSIELLTPNGGDSLRVASSYNITWTSSLSSTFILEYTVDNEANWIVIDDSVSNTGTYRWEPIPDDVSANCRVRIRTSDNEYSDVSDNLFSIVENTSKVIVLTAPEGGEVVDQEASLTIEWISSRVNNVRIEFSSDNGNSWSTVIANYDAAEGSYTWNDLPAVNSNNCLIRVVDVENSAVSDILQNSFSIVITTNMKVITPNGGEEIEGGVEQEIKWFSKNISKVKIEYSLNNGIDWFTITQSENNTGVYYWNPVPSTPSTLAKIRITDVDNSSNADESDETFTILPEAGLTISSPSPSTRWKSGTQQFINWTSKNVANVKIEYSVNNGSEWITITESTPSDGSFSWEPIPDHNSSLCNIRISDASDGQPQTILAEPFTIYNGETFVEVYTPNGGETWQIGSSQEINWFAEGVNDLSIELTTDNGQTWTTLASSVTNTGTYVLQNVPATPASLCKVRIKDAADGVPHDQSDNTFTIVTGSNLVVQVPNGNEQFEAGTQEEIRWFSHGIDNVKIEYTVNNGLDWIPVEDNIVNTGVYYWNPVPKTPSNLAKVRVTDIANPANSDQSNETFTILPEALISVLSPVDGDKWKSGTNQFINWTSQNIANVKIEYSVNNGAEWTTITESTPSDGSFLWESIPAHNSSLCNIRISDASDGQPKATIGGTFTIYTGEKALQVNTPNGGEVWAAGTQEQIEWFGSGIDNVKIELTTNNGQSWSTIASSVANTGTYTYSVTATPSNLCKVKISEAGNPSLQDLSDENFSIVVDDNLSLISPNGGEQIEAGTEYEVTWFSRDISNIKIEYSMNNGQTWSTVENSIVNTGVYYWNPVPSTPTSLGRLRISDANNPSEFDINDEPFSVIPESQITITSPQPGDRWLAGTKQTINWTSKNIENVKIEFSVNNGSQWTTVVASTPSDGSYDWDPVPSHNSSLVNIRISDAADGQPKATLDQTFTIYTGEKTVEVYSPNGGENWSAGAQEEITWFASGINNVQIELTTNNGQTWSTLSSSTSNTGTYTYNVPATPSNLCKVRISEAGNPAVSDISDATFSILVEDNLTVISPNGGEQIEAGTEYEVRWFSRNIDNVKIEYSVNNGQTWSTVANSDPNTGVYFWNPVPATPTSLARIKISDADNPIVYDMSDETFSITPEAEIVIVSPVPGDRWLSGSTQFVNWTSKNIENVKIEYSLNNGNDWTTIVNSTPSDGSYEWSSLPVYNTSLANIRISDASDGQPKAIMDGPFTIYTGEDILELYTPNGGEDWEIGTEQEISWFAEGVTSLKIDYTYDNGQTWHTIENSEPNTGSYFWKSIPNTPTNLAKVRISDATDGSPVDVSDAVFTISQESQIAVTEPNGAEQLQAGSSFKIEWTSTNVPNVKIEYTSNNGASWNPIVSSTESIGFYTWDPLPNISSQQCRIKVSDADDGIPSDVSDANFTITNEIVEELSILSPTEDSEWQSGTQKPIEWSSSGIEELKIEYSLNNGGSWTLIADNVEAGTGGYTWNPVVDVTDFRRNSKIRISDSEDGKPVSESPAFTIRPVPSITLTSPNGGEEFENAEPINFTWESVGVERVTVEVSSNNGVIWDTLAYNILNIGSFGPRGISVASDQYKARVSEGTIGSPSDISDGTFNVLPPIVKDITVLQPNGGENWLTSDNITTNYHEIRWSAQNVDSVKIEYTLQGEGNWIEIATVESNGLYNWAVPKTIQFRSDLAKIRISDAINENLYDISDDNFSIHPQVKLLRITQPTDESEADDFFYCQDQEPADQLKNITWLSAGISHIKIEYSRDNGASWILLTNSFPSNGTYVLPSGAGGLDSTASSQSRVRLTDVSPGSNIVPAADPNNPKSDVSDLFAVFMCKLSTEKKGDDPKGKAVESKNIKK